MDFLTLCKRVRQECGIAGDGPPAVTGQSGIYAKIISWVQEALAEVERFHSEWDFDWAAHDAPLVAGQAFYSPRSDWGLQLRGIAGGGVHVYRSPASRTWVELCDWDTMRHARASASTVQGLPILAAMTPDRRLCLHPAPAAGMRIEVEYYREPQQLVEGTDVPRMPAEYHMAIVWRAVMLWCAHDENPALFQSTQANYRALINRMCITQLPQLAMPEPLA